MNKKRTKQKMVFLGILVMLFLTQFALATELQMVKVSELKVGDVIIDRNGNEIKVESIQTQEEESLTISEYIKQKVFGNESVDYSYRKESSSESLPKIVGVGSSGPGTLLTGNAIYQENSQEEASSFQKLVNKIKGWFGK